MRRILALTFATTTLALAGQAWAQTVPNCPYGAGYVTVTGSTAAQNLIKGFGAAIAATGTTVVYNTNIGSCAGLDLIYSGSAPTGTSIVYISDGGNYSCNEQAGQVPTLAASDTFPTTCQNTGGLPTSGTIPPGFLDVHGPWQSMLFIQPKQATSPAGISAEDAYWVLGFPSNGGGVSPWDLPNENGDGTGTGTLPDAGYLFIRSPGSGTQQMVSSYVYENDINYVQDWVGVNAGGSGNVAKYVAAFSGDPNQNAVLGILALDAYGANKALPTPTLNALPFRAWGQNTAWYPDSSQSANDRQNVRDGHYAISGPVHFVAATTDGTTATDPGAQAFLDVINGTTALPPPNDIVLLAANAYTVPNCAMLITRAGDGEGATPIDTTTTPNLCGCAFEHDVAATNTLVPYTCNACTCATGTSCTGAAGPCPAAQPICNYGYCEAR